MLVTGSAPYVPPIPGSDAAGCFVYRTVDDVEAIRARSAGCGVGVVVDARGGVAVDSAFATFDPAMWAIGECAHVAGRTWGLDCENVW